VTQQKEDLMDDFGMNEEQQEEQEKKAFTRRAFLIGAGAAGGGLVAGGVIGGVIGHQFFPRIERPGFPPDVMPAAWLGRDLPDCTGCKLCEVACSLHHTGQVWPWRSRIRVYQYPPMIEFPVACYQCGTDAKCIAACPVGALSLSPKFSTILVDTDKCLRTTQGADCMSCADACPGGTINHDPVTGAPLFCDMCDGDPACVKVCPSGALAYNGVAHAAALPEDIAQQVTMEYDLPISSEQSDYQPSE
jgi:Fe-S-cluster-containing hydrogenase component 2